MYSLWGWRVLLNIPHFKYLTASGNFYTHPKNVLEIFLQQRNNNYIKKREVFWNLAPRLNYTPSFCPKIWVGALASYKKSHVTQRDPVGWDIFNFVNLENLIIWSYIAYWSQLKKNNLKAPKKSEMVIFLGRLLPCKQKSQQYTALYTTYSHVLDGEIKAIAANWCLIVRTWGDTPAALIVCPTLGRRHQHLANAVGTFNRPLARA